MGTNNFYNQNASKIYAVENAHWDEELEETIYDDSAWDEVRECVGYDLEVVASQKNRIWNYDDDVDLGGTLMSYPSKSIGEYTTKFTYCNEIFEVSLIPLTTEGYYSGFNLDYDIRYYSTNAGYADDMEEFMFWVCHKDKLLNMHQTRLHKKIEAIIDEMAEEVETIFARHSIPLYKVATFSSGEAVYKEAV